MKVQFFSPCNQISFKKVISLLVRGLEGELMILPHHAPYLIHLLPSIITIKTSSQNENEKRVVIDSCGVLEVIGNDCNILTNQVQFFDCMIHDEKILENKSINIYLSYLNNKFFS